MGYNVKNKYRGVIYEISSAAGSSSEFHTADEVCDYLCRVIDGHIILDFDSERTAKDILPKARYNVGKLRFGLNRSVYWKYFPAEAFQNDLNAASIHNSFFKFREHLDKEQNIAALNRLINVCNIPGIDVVTNISGSGNTWEVEAKNNGKAIKAKLFFHREDIDPSSVGCKYLFSIGAGWTYIGLDDVDPTAVELPKFLGCRYGRLVKDTNNKAIYEGALIYHNEASLILAEDLVKLREMGKEVFEEKWRDEYKRKATRMLMRQLRSDFGEEMLDHVEIYEERGCDGFTFDDSDEVEVLAVDLCFDKEFLVKWYLENEYKARI